MLEFAYYENIDLNEDIGLIEKLIEAAYKYKMEKLKVRILSTQSVYLIFQNVCETILLTKINASTVNDYFDIARDFNCLELRKKCVEFMYFEH